MALCGLLRLLGELVVLTQLRARPLKLARRIGQPLCDQDQPVEACQLVELRRLLCVQLLALLDELCRASLDVRVDQQLGRIGDSVILALAEPQHTPLSELLGAGCARDMQQRLVDGRVGV